jgi:hypothetical protein
MELPNHARVATCTGGKFNDLTLDFDHQCLTTDCEVEGIGPLRVRFELIELERELVFEGAEGGTTMRCDSHVSSEELFRAVELITQLGGKWDRCWPAIRAALLQARAEYDKTTVPTPANTTLLFTPPDDDGPFTPWTCSLELEPSDGCFIVEFSLRGEILGTDAIF